MRNEATFLSFGVLCIIFLIVCVVERRPIAEPVRQCFHRDQTIDFLSFFTEVFQLFDVCILHVLQFIVQTNKCTTYIYIFINHILYNEKYCYMFQSIHIICRESYTSILLKYTIAKQA